MSSIAVALLGLVPRLAAFSAGRAYWGIDNETISYANLDGSGGASG